MVLEVRMIVTEIIVFNNDEVMSRFIDEVMSRFIDSDKAYF